MLDSAPDLRKVFIVGPTESLLTKRGNRHPALAKFLVEQGYVLEYLTSDFYHGEKRWFSRDEVNAAKKSAPYKLIVKKCIGYRTNISPRRILSNVLLSLKFFCYLVPRVNKSTILILPSRPVEMIFFAAVLRLLRGTSVALDIQDIWPDALVVRSRLKRMLFRWYCNIFLYPSLRFIDKFFHVAPSFVNWLHRYARGAQSTFIPLGFDNERWSGAVLKDGVVDSSEIRLVCIAQLQFQCDIMPLLKAIESRRSISLKVIGEDGKGERYAEVMSFINNHRMDNVDIVGLVDRKEMWRVLQDADIGVVPMISNSIPNKVFDYLASYLPDLILGENDSSEFVKNHNIGWSVPFDEKAIGKFLDGISGEDLAKKQSSIEIVRQEFDRDNLHQKILKLLVR